MHSELYQRVSPACCYITVFSGDEKISEGTGFAFSTQGEVLTAAHVVTVRWPIRKSDYQDPSQRIFCKFPGLPVLEYAVLVCAIDLEVSAFKSPVQIDLAVLLLRSDNATIPAVPYIPARTAAPRLGEQVFMAGYSEELELPFRVNTLLQPDFPGVDQFHMAMSKGYMADMMGPLFKRGVVGNIRSVVAENTEAGDRVQCEVMYIDNAMHPGASGGPLFNANGEAVGVVSQRAVTSVDSGDKGMLPIPSGCTVAVSLAPMILVAKRAAEPGIKS